MPNVNYADWLTKNQVAERLHVSTKTVETLASKGKLHQVTLTRDGKPPIVVYHPGDVAREVKHRNVNGDAFLVPVERQQQGPDVATAMVGALAAIADRVQQAPSDEPEVETLTPSELRYKLYLTEDEAAAYTGLGKGYLRANAEGKTIGPRGAYVYRRVDLEKL